MSVITPEFRVSFPNLFRPSKIDENSEPKYSVTMLFKKGEDLKLLKQAAAAAAKEKWGDDVPKDLRSPFRNQGEKDYDGYEEGAIFITCSSKSKPGLVNQKVQPIISEEDFYAGCYARAEVVASAYGGKGTKFKPGVTFYLQNVQKLRDGDPFSGRNKPENVFESVSGGDDVFGDDAGNSGDESMFD